MPQRLDQSAILPSFLNPSFPTATTARKRPRNSGIRAGSPGCTRTDLATTFPFTHRSGWFVKWAASQIFPRSFPAAQTNIIFLPCPCPSAAIILPRPARRSASLYCSMIPRFPTLKFTKSIFRPSLPRQATALSIALCHVPSSSRNSSSDAGLYRLLGADAGMANIAMSAPQATPVCSFASDHSMSRSFPAITLATEVP